MDDAGRQRIARQVLEQVRSTDRETLSTSWDLLARADIVLQLLPEQIDPTLMRAVYGRLLREQPYRVWRRLRSLRPEHEEGLVEALRQSASVQSRFLLAAHARKTLPDACRALAKVDGYSRSPLDRFGVEGARLIADAPALCSAAQEVILASPTGPDLTEAVPYYWLLAALFLQASDESVRALLHALDTNQEGVRTVMTRLLGFWGASPSLAALRARLPDATFELEAKSPVRPRCDRKPALAYRFVEGTAKQNDGWARGRPPGIGPLRWPRSRAHGVPLPHVLTVRPPDGYQQHAAGISFFAASEPEGRLEGLPASQTETAESYFDEVGEFVVLWLAAAELAVAPSDLPTSPDPYDHLEHRLGVAKDAAEFLCRDFPPEWLRLAAYDDPNAGVAPSDWDDNLHGYIPAFSPQGEALGLHERDVGSHFGGTTYGAQALPEGLSATYLEIEDGLGGINLGGGGRGHLDLRSRTWTWSC